MNSRNILFFGACLAFSYAHILLRTSQLVASDELRPNKSSDVERVIPIEHENHPSNSTAKFPRIVHQSYKSTELPPNFRSWRDGCIALNPEWEFRIWTDEDNLDLVKEHYPQMLQLYLGYDKDIKRIDMVRYLYLHKFGGIYMDMDMACLKPFPPALFELQYGKFIMANQYKTRIDIANAFMAASPPRLDVFEDIFAELPLRKDKEVLAATGGKLLNRVVVRNEAHRGKWMFLPTELVYGQEWTDANKCISVEQCRMRYPSAITVTFWTHTWKDEQ